MSDQLSQTVTVGDKTIVVRELSVADVRKMARQEVLDEENDHIDFVGNLLLEGISFDMMKLMTDLTAEQIEEMRPSELSVVADKCKEINRGFFTMMDRAMGAFNQLSGQPD